MEVRDSGEAERRGRSERCRMARRGGLGETSAGNFEVGLSGVGRRYVLEGMVSIPEGLCWSLRGQGKEGRDEWEA
eukprot:2378961-Rhodomonas_salina.1